MKDKKVVKLVPLSPDLHKEMKVHVANKQVKIGDFIDKAVRNQIKRETAK